MRGAGSRIWVGPTEGKHPTCYTIIALLSKTYTGSGYSHPVPGTVIFFFISVCSEVILKEHKQASHLFPTLFRTHVHFHSIT